MRILGIDPGTRILGWGLIELSGRTPRLVECGTVEPRERDHISTRLGYIADELAGIIKGAAPERAALEKAYVGKNAHAALRVGEARGVAMAELARAGVPVVEVTPSEVKKAVTGIGSAHKGQVQRMVAALLGQASIPGPVDASDALALALCLAHRVGFEQARTGRPRGR